MYFAVSGVMDVPIVRTETWFLSGILKLTINYHRCRCSVVMGLRYQTGLPSATSERMMRTHF